MDMTDFQIAEILFHPRNEDGSLKRSGGRSDPFKKSVFEKWKKWHAEKNLPAPTDAELETDFQRAFPNYGG